jgi:hypothetical protein
VSARKQTVVYVAQDGERLTFEVPSAVNRVLVARAVRRIHEGANPDLVVRGLTDSEHSFLLDIVGTLEEHRLPLAV